MLRRHGLPSHDGNASFHLRVAVRAQQDTLASFSADPIQRQGDALKRYGELLARGIEVVELQRTDESPVPAQSTLPSALGDEDLLDAAPPRGHPFGPACRAPIPPATFEHEPRAPVHRALELADRRLARLMVASAPSGCPRRFQAVPTQPMPDGGLASLSAFGDLPRRQPLYDEALQGCPRNGSLRPKPGCALGFEAVLTSPIGNRRATEPDAFPDLAVGQSGTDHGGERIGLHERMFALRADAATPAPSG